MAEQQMSLPEPSSKTSAKKTKKRSKRRVAAVGAPDTGENPLDPEAAKKLAREKAKAKRKRKAKREAKAAAEAALQAAAETAKATKKRTKKKRAKKKTSKMDGQRARTGGCEASVHVSPLLGLDYPPARRQPVILYDPSDVERSAIAALPETSMVRHRGQENPGVSRGLLIGGGVAIAAVATGVILLVGRKTTSNSSTNSSDDSDTNNVEETGEEETGSDSEDTVHEDIDLNPSGKKALPAPKSMGKIPQKMTSVYQLFDRFIEGGSNFFANLADSESAHNFYAINPKGVSLSKAGVERQMKDKNYGKPWDGKSTVPYTAYLEPEKAKALGAMGLCQGIAGTIGQAGRRNGRSILAPLAVDTWDEPALQLAAFCELFGALHASFGAKTPEQMRIAWGYPSKATKPTDPYYLDRAKKWAERQKTTGVTASSFGSVTIRTYKVEEVVAYFKQFDYSSVVNRNTPRMVMASLPISEKVMTRLLTQMDEHPAFIGNDFAED